VHAKQVQETGKLERLSLPQRFQFCQLNLTFAPVLSPPMRTHSLQRYLYIVVDYRCRPILLLFRKEVMLHKW